MCGFVRYIDLDIGGSVHMDVNVVVLLDLHGGALGFGDDFRIWQWC